MEKIRYQDIDFLSLEKLQHQGSKSIIYRDEDTCFKILDGLSDEDKELLYRKFIDMEELQIENVLLPKELIIQDGKLQGYTMDYFGDSMTLSDTFMTRYIDCKKLFDYVIKASKILREIHKNKIICQDLSFENILVDKDGNVVFCDLDGCYYKGCIAPFISVLIKRFLLDYRHDKICISKNLDRISMLVSFYYLIYGVELHRLSDRLYNYLTDKISTLENLRYCANMLLDKSSAIGYIPYLDELINPTDDYIIDTQKQLRLDRSFLKNKTPSKN